MRIVMKFGGTSVQDAAKIRAAAGLVKKNLVENEVAVVVSAMDGVTDDLIQVGGKAEEGRVEEMKIGLKRLRSRHETCVREVVGSGDLRARLSGEVKGLLDELEEVLASVALLNELTPRTRDRVLSFGERVLAPIFAAALRDLGLEVQSFSGIEAGIVTDGEFGEANPLMEVTKTRVRRKLLPLLDQGVLPVVTGFVAATMEGEVTTLGRGGSDYTATILATCLKADEVWLWTDVDGVMTADPKMVEDARVIPDLSYYEAIEMVVFGAKTMHPRALEPVREAGIPVRVRNTFNSDHKGTKIHGEGNVSDGGQVVRSVAVIRNVGIVSVTGGGMVGRPGTASKIFDVLGRSNVNVLMISQSVSEANITVVVRRSSIYTATNSLEVALLGKGVVKEVSFEDDVSVVAAIGAGMIGTPGVAARVFGAVARRGVNVRMIAQGSSELNISFVVKEDEAAAAAKAIHDEFKLSSPTGR